MGTFGEGLLSEAPEMDQPMIIECDGGGCPATFEHESKRLWCLGYKDAIYYAGWIALEATHAPPDGGIEVTGRGYFCPDCAGRITAITGPLKGDDE